MGGRYWAVSMFIGMFLLVNGVARGVSAGETDERIESAARKTYAFQHVLRGDAIIIKSTDGIVTLTGSVGEASHRNLAQETVANLPGVKSVDNQMETKVLKVRAPQKLRVVGVR